MGGCGGWRSKGAADAGDQSGTLLGVIPCSLSAATHLPCFAGLEIALGIRSSTSGEGSRCFGGGMPSFWCEGGVGQPGGG